MQSLLSLIAKLNGYKTYIAGAGLILSGFGAVLIDLSHADSLSGLVSMAVNLNASVEWGHVLEGLGLIGLRHAVAKSDAPAPQQPQ
jgi:hypothetical protein